MCENAKIQEVDVLLGTVLPNVGSEPFFVRLVFCFNGKYKKPLNTAQFVDVVYKFMLF